MSPTAFVPDRLLVCLPVQSPVEPLLARASRVADALPTCALEIVAAPVHALHGARRHLIRHTFGRAADIVHLVPHADAAERFATASAGPRSVVMTARRPRLWGAWRSRGAALVAPSDVSGRTVLAIVDPARDVPGVVTTALHLAGRLEASRVLVCHVFFEEGVLRSEACEARLMAATQERLDIFMARVPLHAMPATARLIHAPSVDRVVARLVPDEDVALVVTRQRLDVDAPVLNLPDAMSRSPVAGGGVRTRWRRFANFALGIPDDEPDLE